MGSQVPSPTHVSKSNMEPKSQRFSLEKPSSIWYLSIKLNLDSFVQKHLCNSCWESGLTFCSTPTLDTQVPRLVVKKRCHVGTHVILKTWDSGGSVLSTAKGARIEPGPYAGSLHSLTSISVTTHYYYYGPVLFSYYSCQTHDHLWKGLVVIYVLKEVWPQKKTKTKKKSDHIY